MNETNYLSGLIQTENEYEKFKYDINNLKVLSERMQHMFQ